MSLAPLVCLYNVKPPASYQSPPTRFWPQSPPLAPVAHPSASSSPRCTQLCLQVSRQHLPISGVSTEAPPQRGPPWSPVPCLPSLSHCPPYSPLDKTLITSKLVLHICLSTCLLCIFPHLECPLWGQGPSPSCPALCPLHLVHIRCPEAQCEGTSDDPLLCTKLMVPSDSVLRSEVPWSRDIYSFKAFNRQHQVNGI